jgi:hypothetical protein
MTTYRWPFFWWVIQGVCSRFPLTDTSSLIKELLEGRRTRFFLTTDQKKYPIRGIFLVGDTGFEPVTR